MATQGTPIIGLEDVSAACDLLAASRLEIDGAGLKAASVCIAISASAPHEILLIERSSTLRAHSAQWGLPGGRRDPGETPEAAALRELQEELGICTGPQDILGRLDDYRTRSGYVISPFVVHYESSTEIRPNSDEVAAVFSISLFRLLESDRFSWFEVSDTGCQSVKMSIRGGFLYAPAAAVLFQLRELLCGRITRVFEIEQPVFARS